MPGPFGRGYYITLSEEQVRDADAVGRARRECALERGRTDRYGLQYPDEPAAVAADIWGARCELAGKRLLDPIEWHALARKLDALPDLGSFVDVKGVPEDRRNLIVPHHPKQPKAVPGWAYLLVSHQQHPTYWMAGWAWGRDVLSAPVHELAPARPCHVVRHRDLQAPWLLQREQRKRAGVAR